MTRIHLVDVLCSVLISLIGAGVFQALLGHLYWFSWIAGLAIGFIATFPFPRKKRDTVCRLAGMRWSREQICHNTLVTGSIGSGKTNAVLNLLDQLFIHEPGFGGLLLDAKGDLHHHLLRIADKHGRKKDIVILEVEDMDGRTAYPKHRLNLLEAGGMSSGIVANILADIAIQGKSYSKSSDFFKQQSIENIDKGIQFLSLIGEPVTVTRLHQFLTSEEGIGSTVEYAKKRIQRSSKVDAFIYHWQCNYLLQPGDQRGGVFTSIGNALSPFTTEVIAKVFSSTLQDTVNFEEVNRGKIFCILCPSTLPREKAALNQYFKSIFFYTGSRRFDRRKFEKEQTNLLVCFLDEYQDSVAVTDRNFLDKLRDANCCFVASMQGVDSLVPVIGADSSSVLKKLFRNRFIFNSAPEENESVAKIFGKKNRWKWTHNSKGGASRTQSEEWIIRPEHFKLPDQYCCILHTNGKFRRKIRLPKA